MWERLTFFTKLNGLSLAVSHCRGLLPSVLDSAGECKSGFQVASQHYILQGARDMLESIVGLLLGGESSELIGIRVCYREKCGRGRAGAAESCNPTLRARAVSIDRSCEGRAEHRFHHIGRVRKLAAPGRGRSGFLSFRCAVVQGGVRSRKRRWTTAPLGRLRGMMELGEGYQRGRVTTEDKRRRQLDSRHKKTAAERGVTMADIAPRGRSVLGLQLRDICEAVEIRGRAPRQSTRWRWSVVKRWSWTPKRCARRSVGWRRQGVGWVMQPQPSTIPSHQGGIATGRKRLVNSEPRNVSDKKPSESSSQAQARGAAG